ncbi:hypothetical protein [Thalassotalea sp. Y01]|uniref:hypothetical protein n=1 Tax=Thalassotalea sp. Y01 TaxID=2729613 RepID=UPI00145D9EA8|nr:hypothetical protein [Thalassotalea sp. Y01]NMP16207.1 hypothetical protein [Thalassotalea sp. Y01]
MRNTAINKQTNNHALKSVPLVVEWMLFLFISLMVEPVAWIIKGFTRKPLALNPFNYQIAK